MTHILHDTKEWFNRAKPDPTVDSMRVQLGVHVEEVAEMFDAVGMPEGWLLEVIASRLKDGTYPRSTSYADVNRKELLDSLCDQIVTAVGVAHMHNLDILGAMKEVNRSNWSKFDENGNPIFNEQGKIAKGPNYTKPDLTGMF